MITKDQLRAKQAVAAERFAMKPAPTNHTGVKNITFSNPKAAGTTADYVECFDT